MTNKGRVDQHSVPTLVSYLSSLFKLKGFPYINLPDVSGLSGNQDLPEPSSKAL